MSASFHQRCLDLLSRVERFVTVALIAAEGSVPQNVGARMIVTKQGLDFGTIGGGRVEHAALNHASRMIDERAPSGMVIWNLNRDLGMTCGGRVTLFFESYDAAAWQVVIFGAGHVAQALARVLVTLPCQITCIDSREDWLAKLPEGVDAVQRDRLESYVPEIPDHGSVVCMTRGHSTDLPILEAIAKLDRTFPMVGVIGSKTKAGALRRQLRERLPDVAPLQFHCPVGLPIGSNLPSEIAISIAAQLLQRRDDVTNDPT
ncbi:MAG: xanthine dehydrogenase accessory protein XdhC [Planctomycetota bacterium]